MSAPNFLGLDLSLTSTGFSCGEQTGVIAVPEKGSERLVLIRDKVKELVLTLNISVVLIEGYSFSSRNSHAHAIGELGGVIRVMLHENGVPFVDIPPTCRAKFATGKGNAGKSEVISSVSAKTGIVFPNPGSDDRCDAWVLEEMGLAKAGRPRFSWPKTHLDALEKVDWTPLEGVANT